MGGAGGGLGSGAGGGAAAGAGAITTDNASPVTRPDRSKVTCMPSVLIAPEAWTPLASYAGLLDHAWEGPADHWAEVG